MKKMNSETSIGKVVLNVENLEAMKTFYQDKIGLEIKSETENEVSLGAVDESQTTLLQLNEYRLQQKLDVEQDCIILLFYYRVEVL